VPAITASAPGKIILFGEHAVVYSRPAIAVPVSKVRARAVISANPRGKPGQVHIQAPDIELETELSDLPGDHPLAFTLHLTLEELKIERVPACTLRISSTIPISAGMGSGAAVSVAVVRAFSIFLGRPLGEDQISALVYQIEKLHHGTPSGIDNTVITYAKPVYFMREKPFEFLHLPKPFCIVIGDTGIPSPTAVAVGDVRRLWLENSAAYEPLFDAVGNLVVQARRLLETGEVDGLGALMDENHAYLQKMGVSSPELDDFVKKARLSGALGAKLSGGGRGGNMIALVNEASSTEVMEALKRAGSHRVIETTIQAG